MGRLGLAFRCFFSVLGGNPVPEEALPPREEPKALPPPEPEPEPEEPEIDEALANAPAVQILALLQKEGRLLDFLQEQIDDYSDDQVGAAVRNIHRDCRRVLQDHLGLAPAQDGEEEQTVTVEKGFDPSVVRLIGNVTGDPPFSGVLRHHGWRATEIKIPELPEGHDPSIIQPAEVELP